MATHSSILAWEIPRNLAGYSPLGRKKVGHDLVAKNSNNKVDENGGPLEQFFFILFLYLATFIITPVLAPILLLILFYVGNRIICIFIMVVLFELALSFDEH